MYIENIGKKTNTTFGELCEGECFIVTNHRKEKIFCIKVCIFDNSGYPYYHAVVLDTGIELFIYDDEPISNDTLVEKVNAKVTLW